MQYPKPTTAKKPHKPLKPGRGFEHQERPMARDPDRVRAMPATRGTGRGVMAVIAGDVKAAPKQVYVRSPALLAAIRSLPCMHSGVVGRTQAAHSNWAEHGKGHGIKASDEFTAALSVEAHAELDQGKKWTEAERRTIWRAAWVKTVCELVKRGLWPSDVAIPDIRTHQ